MIFVADIMREVAADYGVTREAIMARRGKQPIGRARNTAIALSARLTNQTLNNLGRIFNGRDHTTILEAIRRGETACASDEATRQALRRITKRFLPRDGVL